MPGPKEIIQQANTKGRHKMIEEAAYFLAEQRGFEGDCQLHDWLEAAAKIKHTYGPAI
jgi:hypothetical protein